MLDRYMGHQGVIFYSQELKDLVDNRSLEQDEINQWQNSLCGLTCALMVLDTFSDEKHSLRELLARAKQINAYDIKHGWIHKGLAELLQGYGIEGTSRSVRDLTSIYELLGQGSMIIASVAPDFQNMNSNPFKRKSGHLVLIFGMSLLDNDSYLLHIHNPGSESTVSGKDIPVKDAVFHSNFSGNIIVYKKKLRE